MDKINKSLISSQELGIETNSSIDQKLKLEKFMKKTKV